MCKDGPSRSPFVSTVSRMDQTHLVWVFDAINVDHLPKRVKHAIFIKSLNEHGSEIKS